MAAAGQELDDFWKNSDTVIPVPSLEASSIQLDTNPYQLIPNLPAEPVDPSSSTEPTAANSPDFSGWSAGLLSSSYRLPGRVEIAIPNFAESTVRYTPSANTPGVWRDNNGNPGVRGNSNFFSSDPAIVKLTGGQPVRYVNGYADFTPFSKGRYQFGDLDGTKEDFIKVKKAIAVKNGWVTETGNADVNAATDWLKANELALHHHYDGISIDVVKNSLHTASKGGLTHGGGASILRNWISRGMPGSPREVLWANYLARGGRYLGYAGMVYGGYLDGKSLVNNIEQSVNTGNWSNTVVDTTRIAGGWGGAWALGSEFGAIGFEIGMIGGPLVAGALSLGFGLVGGAVGYLGGSNAGRLVGTGITSAYN